MSANNKVTGGFWLFSHTGFSPRVRPVARVYDGYFECWQLVLRVTGRDQAHKAHGYYTGQEVITRYGYLYRKRRIIRGSFGRLAYFDRMTDAEFESLPIRAPLR